MQGWIGKHPGSALYVLTGGMMSDEQLVTIATYSSPFEAELAKSFLEEAGFEVELQNERMMSMYSSFAGYMHMIELQVTSDHEMEAKQVLVSLDDSDYVRRILSSEKALLTGHFLLTSGKHRLSLIHI